MQFTELYNDKNIKHEKQWQLECWTSCSQTRFRRFLKIAGHAVTAFYTAEKSLLACELPVYNVIVIIVTLMMIVVSLH